MATPRTPRASGDDRTDGPGDGMEDAVVMPGAPGGEEPAAAHAEPENSQQEQAVPPFDTFAAAVPETAAAAAADDRLAALADRVAAAERAVAERPAPVVTVRKGSPVPGIVGGVIAAAVGFAAAQIVPQGWPIGDTADLRATVASQQDRLAQVADQVAALPAPAPAADLAPLQEQIETLAARVAAAEAAVAAVPLPADPAALIAPLEARIAALESLPPGTVIEGSATADPAATAALQQEIAALKADMAVQNEAAKAAVSEVASAAEAARTALADARAEAARLQEETARAAQAAAAGAALGRITAALETGTPFETAIADLAASGHAVPTVLAENASTGIPALSALQAAFPDAARAALEEALKSDMGDTTTERIATFLRTQVGVRSLEPREGNDPDAVLSRAEAALAAGDVEAALSEIAALPEAGQAVMADWVTQATLRRDARAALADLSSAVGG